jgi:hypothetical protein
MRRRAANAAATTTGAEPSSPGFNRSRLARGFDFGLAGTTSERNLVEVKTPGTADSL